MTQAEPGTVSHGTLRTDHLIVAFMACLQDHDHPLDTLNVPDWDDVAWARESIDHVIMDDEPSDGTAFFLNETLFDLMDDLAPDGHGFGAHPGDGSDFGFWPNDEEASQ